MAFHDIASRALDIDDYTITGKPYGAFKLREKIVAFYNGTNWLVVKLQEFMYYPVIYFEFASKSTPNKFYVNSLLVCPITLRSMIFKGRVVVDKVVDNTLHLVHAESGVAFDLDHPFIDENNTTYILRRPIKLSQLIDIYPTIPDPVYVVVTKEKTVTPLVPLAYNENRLDMRGELTVGKYHPKTVVYILRYFSNKHNNFKLSVLVGRDATSKEPTGYNYTESKLYNYLNIYREKLEKKNSFIFPIYWYMVIKLYSDARIINL